MCKYTCVCTCMCGWTYSAQRIFSLTVNVFVSPSSPGVADPLCQHASTRLAAFLSICCSLSHSGFSFHFRREISRNNCLVCKISFAPYHPILILGAAENCFISARKQIFVRDGHDKEILLLLFWCRHFIIRLMTLLIEKYARITTISFQFENV